MRLRRTLIRPELVCSHRQYSFVRAGIPALSLKFGSRSGSPEQQMEKELAHEALSVRPADNLSQPVDTSLATDAYQPGPSPYMYGSCSATAYLRGGMQAVAIHGLGAG